ncbi:MAG: PIN domain-containing protein [Candidatus Solibacter sp.]
MKAVDTNLLVRLVTWDSASQVAAAEEFIRGGAWVSVLALAEAIWVLADIYGLNVSQQVSGLEVLLSHVDLVIQEEDMVRRAVESFRAHPALGFSDCLMVEIARQAGHLPLGTFDRKLAKLDGTQRI